MLDPYQAAIDEANALMAWGAEGVDNWYKSPTGRVSQNWPLATIVLGADPGAYPGHYRFTPEWEGDGQPAGKGRRAGAR